MTRALLLSLLLLFGGLNGVVAAEWKWEVISQDPPPVTNDFLQDVWCIAENDVYALTLNAIYHYDGTGWSLVYAKGGRRLWASGCADVYAVGENGNTYFHFDGSQWSWRAIAGQGGDVNAVWGTAAGDVFIVGDGGAIFHYDGTQWQAMNSQTDVELKDVWGSSGQDVYAVGLGTILHFDGAQWTSMPIDPSTDADTGFSRVWGASSQDVLILGDGSIYQLDDGQWGVAQTATLGYRDLWGSSSTDIYALNMYGIMHFDGSQWQVLDTGMDVSLNAIHGTASNHIIAVGDSGHIQRYDGQQWQVMTSGAGLTDLCDIWGSGPSDIYAVGASGRILHYDGTQWSDVPSGTRTDLNAAWGSCAGDLYIAGDNATLLHFNGGALNEIALPTQGLPQLPSLRDIWGSGQADVFVAGTLGTIFHFDGDRWTLMAVPDTTYEGIFATARQSFYSVWGTSSASVFATGQDSHYMGHGSYWTFHPKHYDGNQWSDWDGYFAGTGSPPESPADLSSPARIWGTSPTDIYIFSHYELYRFNGDGWADINKRVSGLEAIWGTSWDDLFMVGWYGDIAHYDGLAWQAMQSPTDRHLYAVWGSSATDVYAVGKDNTIVHYAKQAVDPSLDGGCRLTDHLWAKAVFQTPGGDLTLAWRLLGADLTPGGAQVLSGYFYAEPEQFAYGSPSNPEIFVKIYIAPNGWCNIAFNHVTVDSVMVSSALDYAGTPNQTGCATLSQRLVQHQYDGVAIDTTVQSEVVDAVAGSTQGYPLTSALWAKATLQPASGPVALAWRQVGSDLTLGSGDRVVSGYFYAHPDDFAAGSVYNPEVFVKVYIAANGWANIVFNHVTVDGVTVESAHPYNGSAVMAGGISLDRRLAEHTYQGVGLQ